MRILHVISALAPRYGWARHIVAGLCGRLVQMGHQVVVYTTDIDGEGVLNVPTDRPVRVNGVEIHYFRVRRPRRYRFSPSLARALLNSVLSFDVVHIHGVYDFPSLVAPFYCRRSCVPYIVTPHGNLNLYQHRKSRIKKTIYLAVFERANLHGAASIHFTSEWEKQEAEPFHIASPCVIIPLGLDFDLCGPLPSPGTFRSGFGLPHDKRLLLFLGRLTQKKGLDLLIRAHAMVAQQREDVHLVLAGPDEEGYGRQLRRWVAQERLLDRVAFTGFLLEHEKLAALRDADVFVLPSYTENFGVAVVEAMACGLPVVVSNRVGICREIVEAGAGVVVHCDSYELAEALLRLLDDPESRERLGANGKYLAQSKFAWESIAEEMIGLYGRVVSSSTVPHHARGNSS